MKLTFFILLLALVGQLPLGAQTNTEATAPRWSLAPVIGFAPETKWQFGANATLLYQADRADTLARRSNANAVAIVTTNRQYFFHADHRTFLSGERWFLPGAVDLYRFPQLYYGIGPKASRDDEESVDLSYLQVGQQALLRLRRGVFFGGGLRYFRTFDLGWAPGGRLGNDRPIGLEGSAGLAPVLTLLVDRRDDILTPTRGWLLDASGERYDEAWAGTHDFSRLQLDLRAYLPLAANGRRVLAFQLVNTSTSGDVPFTELALLGGERLMRGFYRGRFRDRHLLAGQAEYRFRLLPWLGATTFVGVGNVSRRWLDFSSAWRVAGGVGLRFAVIPGERVALRMDIAWAEGQRNFYFGFAEAF